MPVVTNSFNIYTNFCYVLGNLLIDRLEHNRLRWHTSISICAQIAVI